MTVFRTCAAHLSDKSPVPVKRRNLMRATILDPAQINRRSRWDPLRCYLTLRRTLEPHWYRRSWRSDPWVQFESHNESFLPVDCSASEDEMLLALGCIPSAVSPDHARILYWLARHA